MEKPGNFKTHGHAGFVRPWDRQGNAPAGVAWWEPSTSKTKEPAEGAKQLVPKMELPKGGGAIKGMGEKFEVASATGAGNFSVPIYTTPGRSDFGPALQLSYNSGGGNGVFGMGFGLSVPAIARKTDKALPQYFEGEGEVGDVFVLSGAEDLVPVLRSNGTREEFEESGCIVHPFKPRIEGQFARIERFTSKTTGEAYWRVMTRDNVTHYYGRTSGSRIADPDNPTKVFMAHRRLSRRPWQHDHVFL